MRFNLYSKRTILIIDFFLLLICLLGIYQVIIKAGFSPSGHVAFTEEEDRIVFKKIYSPHLSQYFIPGDTLLTVNGSDILMKDDLEFVLDNFTIGDSINISYAHTGRIFQVKLALPAYYKWDYILTQFVAGIFFIILGLVVFLKRPEFTDARVFHWVCFGAAVIIMCTWGRIMTPGKFFHDTNRLFFSMAYAFEPTLFLHLSLVFPKQKLRNQDMLIKFLYLLSFIMFIYLTVTFFRSINPVSIDRFRIFILGFDLNRAFFTFSILLGLIFFLHSYKRAQEEMDRRKMLWVLLGLILGPLIYVSLWQVPQLLGYDSIVPEQVIVLIMTITPLTFSIAIVKYSLFNIDLLVKRSTVYFFVVAILLIFYTAVLLITALLLGGATVKTSLIGSAIATVLIPLIFDPARRIIQRYVDRKFFRVSYNYRLAQTKITKDLDQFIRVKDLAEFILKEINNLLQITCSGFYYHNRQNEKWQRLAAQDCKSYPASDIFDLASTIEKNVHNCIGRKEKIESGAHVEDYNQYAQHLDGITFLRPIYSGDGTLSAIIILGEKKSGFQFSLEDVDLFNSIGTQIGLTIDRIELQKNLILQYEETRRLEELNKQISLFVASVGHELKTPLTSIRLYAGFLEKSEKLSAEKSDYLWTIKGESERLERLINNVLNISKIERGVMQYNLIETNLCIILKKAIAVMEYQLKQNQVEQTSYIPDEPVFVWADSDAMIEVFTNLISNAIKYSRTEKYVGIHMRTENNIAVVSIEDHGIGISEQDKEHIFEAFYRSIHNEVRSISGTGLGLALVKHIIDAHHGRIEFESTQGKGTTFHIFIPRLNANA